jgi:hypothetical protein
MVPHGGASLMHPLVLDEKYQVLVDFKIQNKKNLFSSSFLAKLLTPKIAKSRLGPGKAGYTGSQGRSDRVS